ncbi:MAG: hypothetical protein JJ916_04645 [Phycisphaerales bacterium]|nr:hypothetical protein [Phycisphaerales bacterium]
MTLANDIASWDTKDATHIKRVYASHYKHPSFHESLLALFPSPDHQDGATWLFKHAIDEGDLRPEAIAPEHIEAMCAALDDLGTWPSRLHALQILTVVPIPDSCTEPVESFARACMGSKKTFVRAWAYSALFAATHSDPIKHANTIKLLESTLNDNSAPASVKARIRNTLKSS